MTAVDIGSIEALNLGVPAAAPGASGKLPDSACGSSAAQAASAASIESRGSFQRLLRDAGKPAAPDDSICAPASRSPEGEGRPMNRLSGSAPDLDALLQLIQSMMMTTDRLAEPAEAPAEEQAEADLGEDDAGFLRFMDLLKQLQTSLGAPEDESGDLPEKLRERLTRPSADSQMPTAGALPGRLHQLLAQLHETVPGVAWGRLAQLISGQGAAASRPAEAQLPGQSGLIPVEAAAFDSAGRSELPTLIRETLKQGKAPAAEAADNAGRPEPSAAFSSARRATEPVSESALPPERPRGPSAPTADAVRERFPAAEHLAAKNEELPSPPAEVSRRHAPESSAPLSTAIEEGGDDGLSAALLRAGRTVPPSESAADKAVAPGAAPRPHGAEQAAVKGDVVEQIVQRAVVQLKNDQGMARIDLKPEFLGQVRMQVVTEGQQVTVRILTELPMVRDLIEQNLHQLKSDLQQQGLQVERVEVSVGDDPRRDAGRQGRAGRRGSGRGPSEVDVPSVGALEQGVRNLSAYWSPGGRTTINTFV